MRVIKTVLNSGTKYYEIQQTAALRFAFVNKTDETTVRQVFAPVMCRDFLGDVLYSEREKRTAEIFGFKYDPNEKKIDRDVTRMSISFPSQEHLGFFKEHLFWLHQLEEANGLSLTKVIETDEKEILIVEGDTWWMGGIWRISAYTFFLRIMTYKMDFSQPVIPQLAKLKGHYGNQVTEADQMSRYPLDPVKLENFIWNLTKQKLLFYIQLDRPTHIDTTHNYCGFLSGAKYALSIDCALTNKEISRKSSISGEYLELCDPCLSDLQENVETSIRYVENPFVKETDGYDDE
jgi:hypothetical protein